MSFVLKALPAELRALCWRYIPRHAEKPATPSCYYTPPSRKLHSSVYRAAQPDAPSSPSSSPSPRVSLPDLPSFRTDGRQVKVLYAPNDFYRYLIDGIRRARRRIFLATLYIGKEETELVQALHNALSVNPNLQVHLMLDYFRSTREAPKSASSASLISNLVAAFPKQVHISLYHTPALSGFMKAIVPKRYNEGWGLWHGKIYGFDDDVLISGANLSRDYFTNRQDRYIAIENHTRLSDYMHGLLRSFASISYSLLGSSTGPNVDIEWQRLDNRQISPEEDAATAAQQGREVITSFMAEQLVQSRTQDNNNTLDTLVQPFLQMGPYGILQETDTVIPALLTEAGNDEETRLDWTSGYFSVRKSCRQALINTPGPVRIVCAAPESNGFYQSAGFSKYIPPAYTYLERLFWEEVKKQNKADSLNLLEWRRSGWTYHAKGIWLSRGSQSPFLTSIGSSNYGYRSATRDIEINLVIQTSSQDLQKALQAEVESIVEHAVDKVDDELFERPERKVGFINRWAARSIADML